MMKGLNKFIVTVFVVVLVSALPALADPIIFTHEGNGSGMLADYQFGASDFIITATGETGDRDDIFGIGWRIDHLSASIWIDGLGDFDFLTGTSTFVENSLKVVGFARAGFGGVDLFDGPHDT
jgi:hypothetical protein